MKPIGIIHTPFTTLGNMPIQPNGAENSIAEIVLNNEFLDGLLDLDSFSHIYLIYLFHRSKGYDLKVVPFLDNQEHGVFATRAPRRPNPIGLSIVKILSVHGNIIQVAGADVLDGTPILDIKPYIEQFDKVEKSSCGWLKISEQGVAKKRSDNRFILK